MIKSFTKPQITAGTPTYLSSTNVRDTLISCSGLLLQEFYCVFYENFFTPLLCMWFIVTDAAHILQQKPQEVMDFLDTLYDIL